MEGGDTAFGDHPIVEGGSLERNRDWVLNEEAFDFVEQARVGALEGRVEDVFAEISAIAVDGLGRLYVADTQMQNVRVFDSLGVLVRSLGRAGRGPGEFYWPDGLTWQNDSTLWVFDLANKRYSVYDTTGIHVRDQRRPPLGSLGPWHARFDLGHLIEPAIGTPNRLVAIPPVGPESFPTDTFPYPLNGMPIDEWQPTYSIRTPGAFRRVKVPFSEGFEWALDGMGGVWVGDTRTGRLVRLGLKGDTLEAIDPGIIPATISDEERGAAIEGLGASARSLDLSKIPGRKPHFRMIVPTEDGGLWLFREGEGERWFVDVVDPPTCVVTSVRLPFEPDLSVRPVVKGGELWFVTRDQWDAQLVVRVNSKEAG
jgi:hypothetical protein